MTYNIYYGTIGNTLGVKYRFTRNCKNDEEAIELAKKSATSFYYKNEGKYGLPSFSDVKKESDITKVGIDKLYDEHINDMMRWYAVPTNVDSIPSKKLRW